MNKISNQQKLNSKAVNWITLIYFCSGVCSLIDEVIWVRLLKLTLGNTVYASSIVVSIFMGGLALGALIMGRYADKVKRRLRLYALLEVLATVSALSLPWLLKIADGAYQWFYVKFSPSPGQLLFVQVLVSACVLLLPAMVMGSTLPLLGRYVTSMQNRVGSLVGRLYALNMLGAALGCFLAGFVLIRVFGLMGSLYIAAAINLLVAIGGWVLSRSHDVEVQSELTSKKIPKEQLVAAPLEAKNVNYHFLMLAFFISGLVSIGYELIWMRSVIYLMGGFTYVFSGVLTIYLLGNVIGAWLGSRLAKRLKNPQTGFAISLSCLGILGVCYIPILTVWSLIVNFLFMGNIMDIYGLPITIQPILHSSLLFIVPSVMMGLGFPLALQAWGKYHNKVGQTTGTVYGINTIGAVLGGIATGFVLIPLVGLQMSITVLGLICVWLGTIMLYLNLPAVKGKQRAICPLPAVALTVAAFFIPSALFQVRFVDRRDSELVMVKEGVTTTVSVHKDDKDELVLRTSGIQVAGDARGVFRIPQKLLGHLGVLLNKNTKDVLTVGFGSGETSASLAKHDLDSIDAVEIAPELAQTSLKYFAHLNTGQKLKEKVNIIFMDAKNYIHLTDKRYDLIINDCINPRQFADNASLYTKEYLLDARDCLKPGGMFTTYLPVAEMPIPCTDSIFGTFMEVFPYITIWFPVTAISGYDFVYLTGSSEPQSFSPKYISEQIQKENIRQSVEYINFYDAQYVLSCYIGDQDDLKKYMGSYDLNSDFTPFVEFLTQDNEEIEVKEKWFADFIETVRNDSIVKYIDWTGISQQQQNEMLEEHERFYKASKYLLNARSRRDVLFLLQNAYKGLRHLPTHIELIELQKQALIISQEALSQGRADEVLGGINLLLGIYPDFATSWLIQSMALQAKGEPIAALEAADKAVQCDPYDIDAQDNKGKLLMALGRKDKSLEHFKKAAQLMPDNVKLKQNLAAILVDAGRINEALVHLQKALEIEPKNAILHCQMGELLARTSRLDAAFAEYQNALLLEPENPDVHNNYGLFLAQQNKYDLAIEHFNKALRIKPDMPEVHFRLGNIYRIQNKLDLTIRHWTEVTKLAPNAADVINNLALILATTKDPKLQNPTEAVQFAKRACEISRYTHADFVNTLSITYSAANQMSEAIKAAQRALQLARSSGNTKLAENIQRRLNSYK